MTEQERVAWVQETKKIGSRTLFLEFLLEAGNWKVKTQCDCGDVSFVKIGYLRNNKRTKCFACYSSRDKKYSTYKERRLLANLALAKYRCENKNCTSYKHYGARGIKFSFSSVACAYDWVVANLGFPPEGQTLDRKNNEGNYEPGNLRWATNEQQALNKRPPTRKHKGRIQALMKLRPDLGYDALLKRVNNGMSDEEVISTPKKTHFI